MTRLPLRGAENNIHKSKAAPAMTDENLKEKEKSLTWKLPYVSPKLTELGTLRDITRTVGGKGNRDGGKGAGRDRTAL